MYTLKLESGMAVGNPLSNRDAAMGAALRIANKRDEQVDVVCPNGEILAVHPSSED